MSSSYAWKEKEALSINELKYTMLLIHAGIEIKECGLKLYALSFIGACSEGIFSYRCNETSTLIEKIPILNERNEWNRRYNKSKRFA